MRVLSLFDESGIMVRPWVEAGVECTILDTQHPPGITEGNPRKIGASIFDWVPDGYYDAIFAFPPCTDLARTASQWWPRHPEGKRGAIARGMSLVQRTIEIFAEVGPQFWLLENPVGQIPNYWRKYDFKFDPAEFGGWLNPAGDAYTKETCLWFSPHFPPLERRPAPQPWSKKQIHYVGPSRRDPGARARARSKTPGGFSYAVFHALYPILWAQEEHLWRDK